MRRQVDICRTLSGECCASSCAYRFVARRGAFHPWAINAVRRLPKIIIMCIGALCAVWIGYMLERVYFTYIESLFLRDPRVWLVRLTSDMKCIYMKRTSVVYSGKCKVCSPQLMYFYKCVSVQYSNILVYCMFNLISPGNWCASCRHTPSMFSCIGHMSELTFFV